MSLRRARQTQGGPTDGDLSRRLIAIEGPGSAASEAYRAMRTNLFYAMSDPQPKVISLTSPGPKEGKTVTCANLGAVLAQAGRSTLVMDCDLRNPVLHEVFGLRNAPGLVDVLAGERDLQGVLREPLPNLKVATAGSIPHNPTELLNSARFAELLGHLRRGFDYVLMDSSHVLTESLPVGPSAEPITLAAQADGVLLVLDAHGLRTETLRQAMRALESVRARVLGTVVNRAKSTRQR